MKSLISKSLFASVIIVGLLCCFAVIGKAQTFTATYGTVVTSLSTTSNGAVTGTVFALPATNSNMVTWTCVADGSAFSATLFGSIDNVTFFSIDTNVVAAGAIKNYGYTGLKFVRIDQVSRTGGTQTTCTIVTSRGFPSTGGISATGSISTTGTFLAGDGTASLPSYAFTSEPSLGFYKPGTNHVYLPSAKLLGIGNYGSGPGLVMGSGVAGLQFSNNAGIGWSLSTSEQGARDTRITRPSAGTIAIDNATPNTQGAISLGAYVFTSLPGITNGTLIYCSDCTIATPCAGSGTGAIAKRLNGIWVCN